MKMVTSRQNELAAKSCEDCEGLIVRALAGVLVRVIDREIPSLRLAMGDSPFEHMLGRFFPRIDPEFFLKGERFRTVRLRPDEYAEVYGLLLENRSVVSVETDWVAAGVALACQGGNHLWQDLALDDRGMLSLLMRTIFAPLANLNVNDMKWKKFLYKRLCELDGFRCRTPSCRDCSDYGNCYGPEV